MTFTTLLFHKPAVESARLQTQTVFLIFVVESFYCQIWSPGRTLAAQPECLMWWHPVCSHHTVATQARIKLVIPFQFAVSSAAYISHILLLHILLHYIITTYFITLHTHVT